MQASCRKRAHNLSLDPSRGIFPTGLAQNRDPSSMGPHVTGRRSLRTACDAQGHSAPIGCEGSDESMVQYRRERHRILPIAGHLEMGHGRHIRVVRNAKIYTAIGTRHRAIHNQQPPHFLAVRVRPERRSLRLGNCGVRYCGVASGRCVQPVSLSLGIASWRGYFLYHVVFFLYDTRRREVEPLDRSDGLESGRRISVQGHSPTMRMRSAVSRLTVAKCGSVTRQSAAVGFSSTSPIGQSSLSNQFDRAVVTTRASGSNDHSNATSWVRIA
jgi:hypothetical protein